MSQFDRHLQLIDTRLFKAFMAAAEAENFTNAAQSAYMTQSGISQHIAKLESQIGVPLFKRIGKRVTLTDSGKMLKRFIWEHANFTESFLDRLRTEHENVSGLCSYAMPSSCLLSPHFSMLLERRKQYANIRLNVSLTPSQEVINLLLGDKIDFGFVTQRYENPTLKFQFFCAEEYTLVASDQNMLNQLNIDTLTSHPFIVYPGVDIYFGQWVDHYFPEADTPMLSSLNTTGRFSAIEGAIKMVEGGLGMSIFPRHCVMSQIEQGLLFEYFACKPPLFNNIYIVSLKNHHYPRVVRQVMNWFFDMHADATACLDESTRHPELLEP